MIISSFVIFSSSLHAQNFTRQYQKAKKLFNAGKYDAAMSAFSPLCTYDKKNSYLEYANFYYALSAEHLGYGEVAKNAFFKIKKIYPQWNNINEVNYWLTKIYIAEREYFYAWKLAGEIQSPEFKNALTELKQAALSKIDDAETLRLLLEEYPNDSTITFALADHIEQPAKKSNDHFNIALLFPFSVSTLDPGPARKKSQFVLDLYEGMKLAVDSLATLGITINLLAYDTNHDKSTINNLLATDELKQADIIVGPLFNDDLNAVQDFSQENKINLFANPVSGNPALPGKNPYAYLFQPGYNTIGQKSAEMAAAKLTNRNCFVYFGNTQKDSLLAGSFITEAGKFGLKVVHIESVQPEQSEKITNTFLDVKDKKKDHGKDKKDEYKLAADSIGCVYVASDSPMIYTKVINSIEARGDSILVVGQETWLDDNLIDLTKFKRAKVLLASPNFSLYTNQAFIDFRNKYLRIHGTLPSSYSQKGYEFMMIFGQVLNRFGVAFSNDLTKNKIRGALTAGYLMQPTHDNGLVPFVTFKNGKFERYIIVDSSP